MRQNKPCPKCNKPYFASPTQVNADFIESIAKMNIACVHCKVEMVNDTYSEHLKTCTQIPIKCTNTYNTRFFATERFHCSEMHTRNQEMCCAAQIMDRHCTMTKITTWIVEAHCILKSNLIGFTVDSTLLDEPEYSNYYRPRGIKISDHTNSKNLLDPCRYYTFCFNNKEAFLLEATNPSEKIKSYDLVSALNLLEHTNGEVDAIHIMTILASFCSTYGVPLDEITRIQAPYSYSGTETNPEAEIDKSQAL